MGALARPLARARLRVASFTKMLPTFRLILQARWKMKRLRGRVSNSSRPILAKQLRLLQYSLRSLLLLVWRIAMLAKDALDHCAEFSPDGFPRRPVDGHISSYGINQLARDDAQVFVAKH